MPNTLSDFWRLILEMKSEMIISLNDINLDDETCCKFWPTAEDPEIHLEDSIVLVFKRRIRFTQYDIYSLNIIYKQVIHIYIYLPFSCDEFFSFWQDADSLSRNSRNIIVTCFDGATASGVFVALSSVIERMRIEKQCDICTAVRMVRHNRKQFVGDQSDLLLLYGAALIYNMKYFS
ncbi:hypothetical protein WA026_004881 [Henosepilachna vigintioctopunctata]|uniref:Tyrosine-protein phosphatase domain-containing protein n=1 Tax=Henosepilachna vigintioctopunctata TaxID=420089 RepID=A0AAW1UT26_9CUCU